MADYPEHLNPFKSRGIRESFRSAKRNLMHTFRKKKDGSSDGFPRVPGAAYEGATLRPHPQRSAHISNGIQRPETEVFPRSRFNERVAKAQTFAPANTENDLTNPFNEPEKSVHNVQQAASSNGTHRRRRRKKRAPLPPGRENMLTVSGDHQNSQWSIASYETDCSSTAYTQSDVDQDMQESPEMLKDIQEISLGIQLLCADENSENEIEPVVNDSSSSHTQAIDDKTNLSRDNDEVTIELHTPSNSDKVTNTIEVTDASFSESISVEQTSENNEVNNNEESNINERDEARESDDFTEVANDDTSCDTNENKIAEILPNEYNDANCNVNHDHNHQDNDNNCTPAKKEDSNDREVIENGDEQLNKDCIDKQTQLNNEHDVIIDKIHEIDCVQQQSIYIHGSDDQIDCNDGLEFNESTTLFITGSTDQLDGMDNGHPTPKVRRNKLTKSNLLGCNEQTSLE